MLKKKYFDGFWGHGVIQDNIRPKVLIIGDSEVTLPSYDLNLCNRKKNEKPFTNKFNQFEVSEKNVPEKENVRIPKHSKSRKSGLNLHETVWKMNRRHSSTFGNPELCISMSVRIKIRSVAAGARRDQKLNYYFHLRRSQNHN